MNFNNEKTKTNFNVPCLNDWNNQNQSILSGEHKFTAIIFFHTFSTSIKYGFPEHVVYTAAA